MSELGSWLIQLLGFAATAGVISGLLTHYLSQRQLERQRREASAYTAIRLAVIFEHFADDCSDVVQRNENVSSSGGAAGEHVTFVPKLASFPPDDDGWKALPPKLTNEALSFQQRIKMANGIVQSALDYAEYGDAVQETNDQCILLGSRAWNLAISLRGDHGFAPLALEFPFHEHLLKKLPGVRERRKAFGSRD
jgi:hypothetical protein